MKYFLLILLVVSCGPRKKVIVENPYDDTDLKNRVTDLENRVSSLEASRVSSIQELNDIESAIFDLQTADGDHDSEISDLQDQVDQLQDDVNSASTQIITLQQNANIAEIVDPCGDGVGFDEVLFKMADGRYVASFSANASGLNTRFSILPPGNFTTTDGTNCNFSISNAGVLSF